MYRISLALFTICFAATSVAQHLSYPKTRKAEQTDVYSGITVSDPYRWLEDDNSAETKEWVKKQNEVTFSYLGKIPFRNAVKERMTALWNFPKSSAPFRGGKNYFCYRNNGLQNQSVLYLLRSVNDSGKVFLDPNTMSKEGTTSLSQVSVSHDGKYMAYSVSQGGSDWSEIFVKDITKDSLLRDHLKWIKFSSIAWQGKGFYYSRYNPPAAGEALTKKNEFHQVFFHRLGDDQINDKPVFNDTQNPLRNYRAYVTKDENWLVISGSETTSGNDLLFRNLRLPYAMFQRVVTNFSNDFRIIGSKNDTLWLLTNYKAPKGRIIKIAALHAQEDQWTEAVAENDDVMLGAVMADDKIVIHYMHDASSRLKVYDMEGYFENDIELPGLCTVDAVNGDEKDTLIFYSVSSFTVPSAVFVYNTLTKQSSPYFNPAIDFNTGEYETKQVFYQSRDSTRIPMFIVHKKGIIPDGNNPTLLFGYGGFNISKTPEFRTERLVFLERGGVFAMPNIRGGGEYGEEWHKAGTKLLKQNVFDDFIAAAEFLIKEKYTSPEKLAIGGRSNGGLLVGACINQRPDLFKAALPAVGVMDMLRFHKFTIGWAWVADYGSSDNAEEFKALHAYSPLHNIKETSYPATLVTTADHDDRVVPAHSFKYISTLQEKHKGNNPVLIRVDVMAGHGGGKPTSKLIDEQADVFSFMMFNLGMKF